MSNLGPRNVLDMPLLPSVTGSEMMYAAFAGNYRVSIQQIALYANSIVGTLVNPMIAPGDIIYGGAVVAGFAVPTRLGLGTLGQALLAGASGPVWTSLATVATTGVYADLTGKPTLGTIAALSYPGGTTQFLRSDGTFAVPPATAAWGGISGTLSAQTDLQTALDRKQNRSPNVQAVVSAATVTPTFTNDAVYITAQATGLTLANPTGTAIDAFGMVIRIKDNGTARAIAYGAQYRAIGVTLPTTTVINKTLYLGMIFNQTDTRWDVTAVAQEA